MAPAMQSSGLTLTPDAGPPRPTSSTPHQGLVPEAPVLRYDATGAGVVSLATRFPVEADEPLLHVALFPELAFADDSDDPLPLHASGLVGVRVRHGDQTTWLVDQRGHACTPDDLGWLFCDQWNLLQLDLSAWVGQRVDAIELVSSAECHGRGWLQFIGTRRPRPVSDPVSQVRTTRGTHNPAGDALSRGNTFPLTAVPHGFNFITPLTDARTTRWLYAWPGSQYDDDPRPALQGIGFCHQPSPWIGDRFNLHFMPWTGRPEVDPLARQRHFRHDDEQDLPHHYRVALEGGLVAEATPTSHAGLFRFTFSGRGPHGIVIDTPGRGDLDIIDLPDGRLAFTAALPAPADVRHMDATRLQAYVYGVTRQPVKAHHAWSREGLPELPTNWGRRVAKAWPEWLRLPVPRPQARVLTLTEGAVLEVAAAVSFISTAQAKRSLDLEIGDATFDDIAARARTAWHQILGRLEIDGGTAAQRSDAWSNLHRLYAWPNEHHENRGTNENPRWAHASPVAELAKRHGRHQTGAEVVEGVSHVNNGYWDTYRTAWPAYHLFTPKHASTLLEGQLAHYREGGWMPRWCAPGYVDCMVGTSSDAIFADAALHRIDFDELTAYDSALKDACVPSSDPIVGRKGIGRARFVGHVDTDTDEGFSWSMENYTCDASIARWSADLAQRAQAADAPADLAARAEEFAANARWFGHRALGWQTLFDARTGFFQGRHRDGDFRFGDDFDPCRWGDDYTETNAWGMAFHVPQDGAGLARALGGEERLAAKLEEALTTPERASKANAGGYPVDMHERTEARALRLGQIGMSNQPAHHTPFMFTHAGQHHRTQWLTREILDRLFVGSEIGQGYPGDEDNGEMSAWWLFAAFGLYPLHLASGEYVITAPLFDRISFARDNGRRLEVRASGQPHRHIQAVKVNGEPWHEVTLPYSLLADDLLIEVELGPDPSDWARDSRPSSLSAVPGMPRDWRPDLASEAQCSHHDLVDDEGRNDVELDAGDRVELRWSEPVDAAQLTLTTVDLDAPQLAVEIDLGAGWQPAEVAWRPAKWPQQTQAYAFTHDDLVAVRLTATAPVRLRQVEVLPA